MRKKSTDKKDYAALSAFTIAYAALIYGLKMDGWLSLSWTALLAPIWAPMACVLLFGTVYIAALVVVMVLNLMTSRRWRR